jgi:hydroxyacylglutathione hydrolase
VVSVRLGRWQANCYVIGDRALGRAIVVDPGEHAERVIPEVVEALDVRVEAILATHGHIDHIWSAPHLAQRFDVPVLLHEADHWLWDDPAAGLGVPRALLEAELDLVWAPPAGLLRPVTDHERLRFGGLRLEARHTPGHTPGHVVYLTHDLADAEIGLLIDPASPAGLVAREHAAVPAAVLLSGDLLFAGSIGRTDFPRGSPEDMMHSLADAVLTLEDDTLVLAGHERHTTVGRERTTNPFLAHASRAR